MTPEQRAKRIHHHMYETCEGIAEHAERIVALEELVAELYTELDDLLLLVISHGVRLRVKPSEQVRLKNMTEQMQELGIEVE